MQELEMIETENLVECPHDPKVMKPGIYQISNEDYHASNGISRSAVSEIKRSPLIYWDKYINPKRAPRPTSAAMTLGRAVNTMLIEPELFDSQFMIVEKVNGATKKGKEYKKYIKEVIGNRTAIDKEFLEKATVMVEAIKNHTNSMKLIDGARFENSIYWEDETTGLLCKTRPDIWNKTISVVCDLKTSRLPCPGEFYREAIDGDYHVQAAMQEDGILAATGEKMQDYIFITMPNERPFYPYTYKMPEAMIERGRREYKSALMVAKKCLQTRCWHAERDLVLPMRFDGFQLNKNHLLELQGIYDVRLSY